jgi:hypothetical protein
VSDYPLSATLKARSDSKWDAPWIVVYGNSVAEVQSRLEEVAASGLIDSLVAADNQLKLVSTGATAVPQAAPAASPAPAAPAQQGPPPAWAQTPQAPAAAPAPQAGVVYHPEGIVCPLDAQPVIFKQITAKASGKTFQLWTCPNQKSKGDGHYSEFAN